MIQRMVVVGSEIDNKVVSEIGIQSTFGLENQLLPVRLEGGEYSILAWESDGKPRPWESDNPDAGRAIRKSREMPVAHRGIGSDVIHVRGVDDKGKFLVKLFYNYKKWELSRRDELHR